MEILLLILLATFIIVGAILLSDGRRPARRIRRVVVDEPRVDLRDRVVEDEVVEHRRVTRR